MNSHCRQHCNTDCAETRGSRAKNPYLSQEATTSTHYRTLTSIRALSHTPAQHSQQCALSRPSKDLHYNHCTAHGEWRLFKTLKRFSKIHQTTLTDCHCLPRQSDKWLHRSLRFVDGWVEIFLLCIRDFLLRLQLWEFMLFESYFRLSWGLCTRSFFYSCLETNSLMDSILVNTVGCSDVESSGQKWLNHLNPEKSKHFVD